MEEQYLTKINERTLKVGVIGLGYVGLPVALMIAEQGFDVVGLDVDEEKMQMLRKGESPIKGDEPGLQELVMAAKEYKFLPTTDYAHAADRDIILIAVDTPINNSTRVPEYKNLKAALSSLALVLKKDALVIIESTIAPGTIDTVVRPLLEEKTGFTLNKDFYLGHCPERVMPGKLLHNLAHYDRVVGGSTPEVATVMKEFYCTYVKGELDTSDIATAEVVKTTENYYRDVQIAFANQLAINCEIRGVDVYKVRELVNKVEHRDVHLPGAGVGGHCIPKDGLLNVAFLRNSDQIVAQLPIKMAELAREINDYMPIHMGELLLDGLHELDINPQQATVAVLGYAYLANSDDDRNSPTESLIQYLNGKVGTIRIHDPYVQRYVSDLADVLGSVDAVVLMVAHNDYRNVGLADLSGHVKTKLLIDGRNFFDKLEAGKHGFLYKGIGNTTGLID